MTNTTQCTTTEIQCRAESKNRAWTTSRSHYCPCISCKWWCCSTLLQHSVVGQGEVEAQGGEMIGGKRRDGPFNGDKSVMVEQGERRNRSEHPERGWKREWERSIAGGKGSFCFLKKLKPKGRNLHEAFFLRSDLTAWATALCSPGLSSSHSQDDHVAVRQGHIYSYYN